ncbi:MAG TPA: hypothetical protein K8U84_09720 [Paenalcaligenes hominis]|uniref:Uncharacterized protein n=1 Tax=Paenalcaligenes hominis TaxID=643674 RepID=A0A9D2VI20_9BURK|nr:hypothetical protein [Paenalcaligenes hominis]
MRADNVVWWYLVLLLVWVSPLSASQDIAIPPSIFKSDMVRAISAPEHWSRQDRTWRYQTQAQTRWLVGNSTPKLSSGIQPVELGGIGLTDQWQPELFGNTLQWRYGATVGLVDHSQTLHQFDYRTGAARAWFDVTLSNGFSIDGIYQRAHDYEQVGLGTHYQLGSWGQWALNMAHSQAVGLHRGQRYQTLIELDLSEQAQLALRSEKYIGQFSALNQRRHRPTAAQRNHQAAIHWDAGPWGTLKAHYDRSVVAKGQQNHAFGLGQQVWYSPNMRIDVDAQRQTHSGDYNMGLRFSFPLF